MKIKHHDIEVDIEKPFANCKLDRKKYADALTNIVGTYADGFVLAINNEWGTGKTTFIKMWQQHLRRPAAVGITIFLFHAFRNPNAVVVCPRQRPK